MCRSSCRGYARQTPEARIDADTTAIRRLEQGISVSCMFDLDSLEASLAGPIPENDMAALQDLLPDRWRQYERLGDVPGHLRITTSHAAHRQSIRDADEIVHQAQLPLRQLRPSGTDGKEARQRGSAAPFDLSGGFATRDYWMKIAVHVADVCKRLRWNVPAARRA